MLTGVTSSIMCLTSLLFLVLFSQSPIPFPWHISSFVVVVTNYRKFSLLKRYKLTLLSSWRSEVPVQFQRPEVNVSAGWFLQETLGENLLPCLRRLPAFCGSSCFLASLQLLVSLITSPTSSFDLLASLLKGPFDYI